MFGFKKKTVDEILSAIEKLSDEDRKLLIASLTGKTQTDDPPESDSATEEIPPTAEESTEEQMQTESEANNKPQEPAAGNDETTPVTDETSEQGQLTEASEEQPQEGTETAAEGDGEADVHEEPVPNILPADTPTDTAQSQNPTDNSQELFAAQNAKIEALESQIAAIQEMLENIVSAADQQNFGSSPEGDFDDEEHSSRYSTILQSYAGRRAKDYQ